MKYSSFAEMTADLKANYSSFAAVAYEKDGKTAEMNYGDFIALVEKERDRFASADCSCVGIPCYPCPAMLADILAASMASKRVVLIDVSQPSERIAKMIESTDVDYLCSYGDTFAAKYRTFLAIPRPSELTGEGPLLFFTSGTTGFSRAAVVSSRALCFSAWNGQQMLPCCSDDRILSIVPIAHVFGFVCSFLWPLSNGACIALGRGLRKIQEDPAYFRPTIIPLVPSVLEFLVSTGALCKPLRMILVGAAPCTQSLIDKVRSQGYSIRFGYGLTETASGVAISVDDDHPFAFKACPDTVMSIAPDGEILLRTPCMMNGYWHDPKATEDVIKDGVLHTGDLGRIDVYGSLYVTGRKKDILILSNGTKIYCTEWESQLFSLFPGHDLALTQNGDEIILVMQCEETDSREIWEKLNSFNKDKPFGQVISKLKISDKPLPRTATGKVQRWKLHGDEKK
jgi:long-subunit acyl-CoA synthetase (AMP-forming)